MIKILQKVVAAPTWLAGVFVFLMAIHMSLDVATKYFFSTPVNGTVEVVSFYYMIGIVFLPLGWIELRDRQISVDLIHDIIPPFGRRVLRVAAGALGIIFFSILAIRTGGDALRAFEIREIAMGQAALPIWPARLLLPIGFVCGIGAIFIRTLQELGLIHQVQDV